MELQQRHEAMVGQWRSALEQREREMEDLQERLNPPRDLDLLRAQIAEEMSASHAAHVAALQAEADGFRTSLFEMQVGAKTRVGCARCCVSHQASLCCALQRSYESARAEHESFTQDQAREAEATHLAHKAALAGLQRTVANLQVRPEKGRGGSGNSDSSNTPLASPGAHRRGRRGHHRSSPGRQACCRRLGGPRPAAPGEAPQRHSSYTPTP